MLDSIKAIGFDLDDTLYDRNRIYKLVFDDMKNYISIDNSFEEFNYAYQKNSILNYQLYMDEKKTFSEYRIDRITSTYHEFGIEIEESYAKLFDELYNQHQKEIKLHDNVQNLISRIQKKNIKTFILTNGSIKSQQRKIKYLELDKFMSRNQIFISKAYNYTKPDKRIFKIVQETIEEKSNNILYVGDHLQNDIFAGLAVGWHVIFFNYNQKEVSKNDFYQVNNFYELENLLEKKQII